MKRKMKRKRKMKMKRNKRISTDYLFKILFYLGWM